MADDTKFCPWCKQDVPITDWTRNDARGDGLTGHCRKCHLEIGKEGVRRKRAELIAELGGKCVRCGFDDIRALQIDHVNGCGKGKRTKSNSAAFYKTIRENPDEYQLLCANCNAIKRIENNEFVGARVYQRNAPTERRKGPGKHNPEANARRSASVHKYLDEHPDAEAERRRKIKAYRESMTDEQKAEISRKISAARKGTKRADDGTWYRPDE